MFLKARYKILRKYDTDIWNFLYYRQRKNKFFTYFKLSLIHKLQLYYRNNSFKFENLNQDETFKLSKLFNFKLLNLTTFFKKSKLFVKRLFFKFINLNLSQADILFGIKSAFKLYKPKIYSAYFRQRLFFKKLILFYNNFSLKKLKRLTLLSKKARVGNINYFFFKLESRLDSILLRLNIGTRFFIRKLIRSNLVLVNNLKISYFNFQVNEQDLISFSSILKKKLYKILFRNIKFKRFFSQVPYYLEINYRTLCLIIIPQLIEPTLICYPFILQNTQILTGLHTALWGW